MTTSRRVIALLATIVLTSCMSPENPPTATPTTHTAQADTVANVVQLRTTPP